MSFPIIGTTSVWENWENFGSGSWNMWFIAPYGSWAYAGFVKNNTSYFKKINIGTEDPNYEISDWDFGLATNPPPDVFPYERHDGYPNGSMGMGVIRGTLLYLAGRSDPDPIQDAIIHRFTVASDFAQSTPGTVPLEVGGGSTVNVNHIAGIEVDPSSAYYLVLNNNDSNEFRLYRYAYTWDGGDHQPTHNVTLSDTYMENNSLARIRGITTAVDGNIILFVNAGITPTGCKVLKFDKDDLSYLGQTTWSPNVSTSTWGHLTKAGEVFMWFQGLDSSSLYDWKTAIYYDRATAIPDEDRSNFIIGENLTTFGSDDAIELSFEARDAFNIVVPSVNAKFVISGEDPSDPDSWNDRVGAIKDVDTGDFFDSEGVPLAIQAITLTNGSGIATAYYKPMRSGSGTEIDAIDVYCPSDS